MLDFNLLRQTSYGMIGVESPTETPDSNNDKVDDVFATFEIKRLTKANSFIVIDETFYIAKKLPDGKPASTYLVYRISDMRLIASSSKPKDETISIVQRKYYQYM